jgi:hypothetical protein
VQELQQSLMSLRSTDYLHMRAYEAGMVVADTSLFISVKDGKVYGDFENVDKIKYYKLQPKSNPQVREPIGSTLLPVDDGAILVSFKC